MDALRTEIMEMPGIDVHSHLRGEHTEAHDAGEVFFYHVATHAMVAAGMPPELARGDRPVEERIRDALPYMSRIRNTTMFQVIAYTLERLHGFDAHDLTWANWEPLCARFRETSGRPGWAREVLCEHARLAVSITSTPSGRESIAPDQRDFLDYTCEQPITHADILHLLQRGKGSPILTTEGLRESVATHIKERIAAGAGSFTYWPTRGFRCPPDDPDHVDELLDSWALGKELCEEELQRIDGVVAGTSLEMLNQRDMAFVLCLGITQGPLRRTLLRYDADEPGEVLAMALRYPRVRFLLMLGNVAQSQELCAVAKQVPNVYMASSWWHGMYPSYAERELEERLETIPYTRLVAIITDAYCAEWSVARSYLSRHVLANVLRRKVASRDYSEAFALEIARAAIHDSPVAVFRRDV